MVLVLFFLNAISAEKLNMKLKRIFAALEEHNEKMENITNRLVTDKPKIKFVCHRLLKRSVDKLM